MKSVVMSTSSSSGSKLLRSHFRILWRRKYFIPVSENSFGISFADLFPPDIPFGTPKFLSIGIFRNLKFKVRVFPEREKLQTNATFRTIIWWSNQMLFFFLKSLNLWADQYMSYSESNKIFEWCFRNKFGFLSRVICFIYISYSESIKISEWCFRTKFWIPITGFSSMALLSLRSRVL